MAKSETKNPPAIKDDAELPLKNNNKNASVQTIGFMNKLRFIKSHITVEPALAMFIIPSVLSMLATQNLNLEKACKVNLNFREAACSHLQPKRSSENRSFEEIQVHKLVASVYAWKSVVHTALPTVIMLFLGAWSDKTGKRKICMLIPIFGEFMTCVLNMISTYFFYQIPVEWTVFMEILFPATTGGWYTMFLGVYSYIGDITTKETRTFRIGILNMCMTVGFPVGMGLSGILLKKLGYYAVFGISAVLKVINFLYVLYFIEDHTWLNRNEKVENAGIAGFFADFFNFQSLKETFQIVFKKGPQRRRLRMTLVLVGVCLYFGPLWGEMSIFYISVRYRFHWDEVKFSIFSTYNLLLHSVGTLFALTVFSKKLKLDDSILGIISTVSKICGCLVFAFANNEMMMYVGPLVEILNGTTAIANRSIASKLVSFQELGKVFSLFGIAETLMPIIFAPTYTQVYKHTLTVFPGAIFLISVVVTIPAAGIFGWFYYQHKKDCKMKITNPQMTNVDAELPTSPTTTVTVKPTIVRVS